MLIFQAKPRLKLKKKYEKRVKEGRKRVWVISAMARGIHDNAITRVWLGIQVLVYYVSYISVSFSGSSDTIYFVKITTVNLKKLDFYRKIQGGTLKIRCEFCIKPSDVEIYRGGF